MRTIDDSASGEQAISSEGDDVLNVLLVEDEALIMLDLSLCLEREGFKIAGEALSLTEGFRVADMSEPDVAVLDINVRDEQVWPLARHLASRNVGLVFVSANLHHQELCDDFAVNPRVEKPASHAALIAAVRLAAEQRAPRD